MLLKMQTLLQYDRIIIIGNAATDSLYLPDEYGLRDPYSAELQSSSRIERLQGRKQKINIKTSVKLYQNKTNVIKMFTNKFSISVSIMLGLKYKLNEKE